MKITFLKVLFILEVILCLTSIEAQVVSGWVVNKVTLKPISDANVVVSGTSDNLKTDSIGYFKFNGVINNQVLLVSKKGYDPISINIKQNSQIIVKLSNEKVKVRIDQKGGGGGSTYITPSNSSVLPKFSWPPPSPSAKVVLPKDFFANSKNLEGVNNILLGALDKCKYDDRGYFSVPSSSSDASGFSLVTRLEQIDKNGVSKKDPNRWNINQLDNDFSFKEYIKALFFSNPGHFRVIVFIVTDAGFNTPGNSPDRETALAWIDKGNNALPKIIKDLPYKDEYVVTALIYEYELPENSDRAHLVNTISGRAHLIKTNLWEALTENR